MKILNELDFKNERRDGREINFSDKTGFVVGFSALLIALFPYKELAQSIIIPIFNFDVSIYKLAGTLLLMLFLSTYLYGLNYVRYDFPTILNFEILKYLELLAHIFYMLAFIFPVLIVILSAISSFIKIIPDLGLSNKVLLINLASSIVSIAGVLMSYYTYKTKEKDLIKELTDFQSKIAEQVSKTEKVDKLSLLNLYESILANLEALLVPHAGLAVQRITPNKIVRLASNKQILSFEDVAVIDDLRGLRNQIAHNNLSENIILDQALYVKGKNILNKLEQLGRGLKEN